MNYTQIVVTNETAAKLAYCVTAHDEGYMTGALVALVSVGCTDVSDRFEFCIIYVGDTPAPHLLQTAGTLYYRYNCSRMMLAAVPICRCC